MMLNILIHILADVLLIPIVLIGAWALLVFVPKGERFESYSRVIMAGLTAYLVAKLLGSIFQPEFERPFQLMGAQAKALYLNNPGFPSDHVLFSTAIILAVWFETKKRKIAAILLVLTILTAIGRVAALVHTPLDVIGGFVIAFAGVPWYLQREKAHAKTGTRQKHKKRVK